MSKAERRMWKERGYIVYNDKVEVDQRSPKCWAINRLVSETTLTWMMRSRRIPRRRPPMMCRKMGRTATSRRRILLQLRIRLVGVDRLVLRTRLAFNHVSTSRQLIHQGQ
jgi:hypothetical protein